MMIGNKSLQPGAERSDSFSVHACTGRTGCSNSWPRRRRRQLTTTITTLNYSQATVHVTREIKI